MTKQPQPALSSFLAFKYWPTWLGIGILCLAASTPFRMRTAIGSLMGKILYRLARDRRYITQTNISLCFPELSPDKQRDLVYKVFIENGIGLIETFASWIRNPAYFQAKTRFVGTEFMDAALAKGKGVLLLGAHYSTLDLGCNLMSGRYPVAATYRPHRNPLFDAFIKRGRLNTCVNLFDRNDIRGSFKHLKGGGILWYAPDQDYGPAHAVYAPFFSQTAATITAASRFAKTNNSPVIILRQHRLHSSKEYEIEFTPVTEEFPSGDDIKDASLINQKLEAAIKVHPEQYLWMHKRFKTQALGKPASPYIDVKTPNRKIPGATYNDMIEKAKTLEEFNSKEKLFQLAPHIQMKTFSGVPRRLFDTSHPAIIFSQYAKKLRLLNIGSIVVDSIYRIPEIETTAVIFYPPAGDSLYSLFSGSKENFPCVELAKFIAKLHKKGIQLNNIKTDKIIFSENKFNILNPEDVDFHPSSLSNMERCNNMLDLLSQLQLTKSELMNLCHYYSIASELQENKDFILKFSKVRDICFKGTSIH